MTKKDYIAAAKLIREQCGVLESNDPYKSLLYSVFVRFFAQDNPQFDTQRFHEAIFSGKIRARKNCRTRDLESAGLTECRDILGKDR